MKENNQVDEREQDNIGMIAVYIKSHIYRRARF